MRLSRRRRRRLKHPDNQILKASRIEPELILQGKLLLIKMNDTAGCGTSGRTTHTECIHFLSGLLAAIVVCELQAAFRRGCMGKSVNNRSATTVFAGAEK